MELERVLGTYTLEELFELNDVTEEEVLEYLVNHNFLRLPEILPLDVDDES